MTKDIFSNFTVKELENIRATLGGMIIQGGRGMWATWWVKFCHSTETLINDEIKKRKSTK